MAEGDDLYHALTAYTLQLRDLEFIHQHVVDAYAVQGASRSSKPIGAVFGLIGLLLHVEKGLTGRQVQRTHMQLVQHRREWPRIDLPKARGGCTVVDLMAAPEGRARDAQIHAWCASRADCGFACV